jgi:cytochrome P450
LHSRKENKIGVKPKTLAIDVLAFMIDTKNALKNVLNITLRPWLWMDCIARMTDAGKECKRTIDSVNRVTEILLRRRKLALTSNTEVNRENGYHSLDGEQKTKPLILLDILLSHNLEHPNTVSDTDLMAHVKTFLTAGIHTNSISTVWTLSLIGQHPVVQQAIHDEIDAVFGDDNVTLTMYKLNQMKYTECVIKESLRLYPLFPILFRTTSEAFRCGKYLLPKNTEIAIFAYHMHRLETYFPDADKFIPERWLFTDENCDPKAVPQYAYIPFGAGARICIGQRYAIIILKSILAIISRKYRITSLEKTENLERNIDLVLEPNSKVAIKFEPRF